jgi:hypothetical protein
MVTRSEEWIVRLIVIKVSNIQPLRRIQLYFAPCLELNALVADRDVLRSLDERRRWVNVSYDTGRAKKDEMGLGGPCGRSVDLMKLPDLPGRLVLSPAHTQNPVWALFRTRVLPSKLVKKAIFTRKNLTK